MTTTLERDTARPASAADALTALITSTGGQTRPGQQKMTAIVEATLRRREVALIEGPTGTGKTFAYLVPALLSGQRVIVSTYSKALQSQLLDDARAVAANLASLGLLPEAPTVAVLKGRSAYACLAKVRNVYDARTLQGPDEPAQLPLDGPDPDQAPAQTAAVGGAESQLAGQVLALRHWADNDTDTGEQSDAPFAPPADVWRHLSVGAKECLSKLCPVADECFADSARAEASSADVVIVNHALLAQLMVVGGGVLTQVLGDGVYIVDECHEFESVLARASGAEITSNRLKRFLQRADTLLSHDESNTRYIENAQNAAAALFGVLPKEGNPDRSIVRTARVRDLIGDLKVQIETIGSLCFRRKSSLKGTPAEATAALLTRTADTLAAELGIALDFDPSVCVAWAQPSERDPSLHVAQFDVSALCAQRLLAPASSTILTSATVTVSGSFDIPSERLGLKLLKDGSARPGHGFVTLSAETPFDYPSQGRLLLPNNMPDPKSRDDYRDAAAEVVCRMVAAAGGRTLSLHTGWEGVRHTERALRQRFPDLTVLAQEKGMPTTQLVAAFMANPRAVLVGTRSFMTGVSLPGDACTCVCLDRIPFPIPSDPIVAARTEAANRRGGDGFNEVSVAEACLTVNQASGRLIRTIADRGVFVLCDPRVTNPRVRYRTAVLGSLPAFSAATEAEATAWLQLISAEAAVAQPVDAPAEVDDDYEVAAW